MRLGPGAAITYTDGAGSIGRGTLAGRLIARVEEWSEPPPVDLEIAVAPPHERERIRFLVEKAQELGVRRLRWLDSRFGNARPSQVARASDWAVSALEQSRGGWLMVIESDWLAPADLDPFRPTLVAMADGTAQISELPLPLRVVVGPEGGWAEDEIPSGWSRFSLGRTILRTETAVVATAVWVSSHSTNFAGD